MYNIKGMIEFLSMVHPELNKKQHYLCTEIRAIPRDGINKVAVLQLWNLENDEKRMNDFFQELKNGHYCVYYSVGTFHFVKHKATKMKKETYLSTHTLVVDFDGITEEEYKEYLDKIKGMGLKPMSISSGHGYQMIFLLTKPEAEPTILKRLCLRMQEYGFPVDMKACTTSQLMRLPYTYNCKELDVSLTNYYNAVNPNCPPVYIYEYSDERHECDILLGKFPKIDNEEEKLKKNINTKRSGSGKRSAKEIDRDFVVPENNGFRHYSDIISEEEYDALHTPVKAMLTKCCEGYRNISLFYLTHYLKEISGFSDKIVSAILNRWGNVIGYDGYYDINSEFERVKKYSPNILNTKYDFEMAQKFGKLPKFVLLHKKNGNIVLPNGFFSNFKNVSPKAVKTYFSILYFCYNKNTFSVDEIVENTKIPRATFFRHIEELKEKEMLENYGGNKYALVIPQSGQIKGYTEIPCLLLKKALFSEKEYRLSASELKVFIYLLYRMSQKSCFWDSQTTIGKALGMSQGRISEITTKLSQKKYIYKHCFKKKFTLAERILTKNAKYVDKNYHNFLKICEMDVSNENVSCVKYHCIYYKEAPEELIFYSSDKKMPFAA